jgi:hypothetical protein
MNYSNEVLIKYSSAGSDYSVVVEDNGRVAYAYLLRGTVVVGDVWLYNRGLAPREPEWTDRSRLPFANPSDFADETPVDPIRSREDIGCEWDFSDVAELEEVRVLLRGVLVARLKPGSKPGWSKMAIKDGPLARRLIV